MISVAGVFREFPEPSIVLDDSRFKLLESVINKEEISIIFFLTKMKEEIVQKRLDKESYLLEKEIKDLYNLSITPSEIRTVFFEYFKDLIQNREFSKDDKVLYLLILELNESLNLDNHFEQNINPDLVFEKNEIFIKRGNMDRIQLIDILNSIGFNIN